MIKNNSGSSTILFIFFIKCLAGLFLIFIMQQRLHHEEIKARTKNYLCFKHQIVKSTKYLNSMAEYNQKIRIAYLLTLNPATAKQALIVHKSLIMAQKIKRISYLKKLATNSYCSLTQSATAAIGDPYTFARKIDGTLTLRRFVWKFQIPSLQKKEKFILAVNHHNISPIKKSHRLETNEIIMPDLSKLKLL